VAFSRESNEPPRQRDRRLSLRPPQRHSLEILDRVKEVAPPKNGVGKTRLMGAGCFGFFIAATF
jgi:galactokinase/mevalonate kinase-like predicted kinase